MLNESVGYIFLAPSTRNNFRAFKTIFEQYYVGIYSNEYTVSIVPPFNLRNDMFDCKTELIKEEKKVGYILKDDKPIAIIGYTE